MTKRLHFTLEVLEDVLSDDEDLDDEPMMEASDEFSDLDVDENEDDIDGVTDINGAQGLSGCKCRCSLIIHNKPLNK